MPSFGDRLTEAVQRRGTPAMVGLDPRIQSLPAGLLPKTTGNDRQSVAEAYRQFCREIIDVVAPLVGVVKPQAAFFEAAGPAGMQALFDVIQYARQRGLLVVLDGKRNDIGSTAAAYAEAYLGAGSVWKADALTVSPYLGADSLTPFVEACQREAAGIFVLVKTSNPGGGMLQDLTADGQAVYQHVAQHVQSVARQTCGSSGYGDVGAVVGATYPEQLAEARAAMPSAYLLVPGYGAQGGTAEDVKAAMDERGLGAVVNSSRGIIFAHQRSPYSERYPESDWQRAVEDATRDMIAELRP